MPNYNDNVGYITQDKYSIHVFKGEPIFATDVNLSINPSLQYRYHDRDTWKTVSSYLNSSGYEIKFNSAYNNLYDLLFTFYFQASSFDISTECLIAGCEISYTLRNISGFSYYNRYISATTSMSGDAIDQNYFSTPSTTIDISYSSDPIGETTAAIGTVCKMSSTYISLPIQLSFNASSISSSPTLRISDVKLTKIYYIPRFNLNLYKFNILDSHYVGFLKYPSDTRNETTVFNYYLLPDGYENDPYSIGYLYEDDDVYNIFNNNNYSYNEKLYSFGWANWSYSSLGAKTTSQNDLNSLIRKQTTNSGVEMVNVIRDKDLNLYLVQPTLLNYTITYNYNSGSYTNNYSDTSTPNSSYTILSNSILYEEATGLDPSKNIAGWTTVSGDIIIEYTPEQTLTLTQDLVLYAVWEDRDSVTINPSIANITTIFFNTTPSAQDGLTYYFNRGLNKKVTLSIDIGATNANRYYINSVTGANGTIAANGQRSWTGNDVTNTGSTAISTTINVTYYRNLQFFFYLYAIEKNNLAQPNFTTEFYIQENGVNGGTASTENTNYNYKYKAVYLNPGDTISYNTICSNDNYYIAKAFTPDGASVTGYYSTSSNSISNAVLIPRLQLKAGYSGNNAIATITGAENSFSNSSYIFSVPTGADGVAFMGNDGNSHKTQRAYIIYEPFHCQYQINNYGYDPLQKKDVGYNENQTYLCVKTIDSTTYTYTYKFFNDTNISDNWYISRRRGNNDTKYLVYGLRSTETLMLYGQELLGALKFGATADDGIGYNYFPTPSPTSNKPDRYICPFLGWQIYPTQNEINTYNSINNLYVNWSANSYRCAIVIKLPSDEYYSEEDPAMTPIDEVITFDNNTDNNWYKMISVVQHLEEVGDEVWNRQMNNIILTTELFNTGSTSAINLVLRDVANSGYVLKSIEKYSYNGNCELTNDQASVNYTFVTRETLDSMDAGTATNYLSNNFNMSRLSPDTTSESNDKLILNKSNLNNSPSVVDYYFITYEEGLPIFYPDSENNPKRAVQLFWEGTRVIGLYYENTRLL